MRFQKIKPQVKTYRNYENFDNGKYQVDAKTCRFDIDSFKEAIVLVFNKHTSIRKKYIRSNEVLL